MTLVEYITCTYPPHAPQCRPIDFPESVSFSRVLVGVVIYVLLPLERMFPILWYGTTTDRGAPIPCSNVKASTSSCSQQTEGGLSNDATIIRPTATLMCRLPFYGRLKLWGSKSSISDRHAYYDDNFCNNCVIPSSMYQHRHILENG